MKLSEYIKRIPSPNGWLRAFTLLAACVFTTLCAGLVGVSGSFPPAPEVHDEFAILLAADTYASGRLTNPTHAMSRFFDSIYVLQQPSYMAKYPPVQGMMLALGKTLGGEYIVGAWISCGIMAAAILWMLQGFLAIRWAIYGTLIAVLQIGIFSYWSHSYWGSTMAVAAGALVIGGTVRVLRRPETATAILVAIGLLILANSRPYDGLAASIPLMLAMIWRTWTGQVETRRLMLRKVLLPATIVLAIGAMWMGYNNHRVTGNPLKLAYQEYSDQYMVAPAFLWQRPSSTTPQYTHPVVESHHLDWEMSFYETQRSLGSYLIVRGRYLLNICAFYVNWVLAIPFLVGLVLARRKDLRLATLSLLCVFVAVMLTTWSADRFISPAGSVIYLLVTIGVKHVTSLGRAGPFRICVALAFPLLMLLVMVLLEGQIITPQKASTHPMKTPRMEVLRQLQESPGKDLVLVRSPADPNMYFDWVYNGANIDQQEVIFARYYSADENRPLLDYYATRRVWLLEVTTKYAPVKLTPY